MMASAVFSPFRRRLAALGLCLISLGTLAGCAAAVVGGAAATTTLVATDRRTTGEQVEDKAIELKAASEGRRLLGSEGVGRINSHSYAGQLLIVGDVPTEDIREQMGSQSAKIEKVDQVINRLRVGAPTDFKVRTNDTWLTTRVTTELINTRDVPSRTISVTTERGVVYLQGYVTADEGERAGKVAASVPGVNKVVKLFQYIKAERLQQRERDPDASMKADSTPSPESQRLTNSDGPEVMAIE